MDNEVTSVNAPERIFLHPIAAPSILGLFGFAAATFMVAANMAGWYGNARSDLYLAPLVTVLGVAQLLAGMWAYQARDGLATAMHGTWGSFWLGYGILTWMFAVGTLQRPQGEFIELTYWFIVVGAITWAGAIAATARSAGFASVLMFLATGSTLAAIGFGINSGTTELAAAYAFLVSAVCAFYTASALMLEESYGREVLPLGKARPSKLQAPRGLTIGLGEPGVIRGQ